MKKSAVCLLGVALLVFSGCKPSSPKNNNDNSIYIRDKRFKSLQNKKKASTLRLSDRSLPYNEDRFNYFVMEDYPKVVIQNTMGTLVAPNEFGTLELVLAESASHNEDYTEYSFKLRDDENMIWVKSDGNPYLVDDVPLRVKPSDFAYGIRKALAQGPYQILDYIKGSVEYYLYTYFGLHDSQFAQMSDQKKANAINNEIKNKYKRSYEIEDYANHPLTADDIPDLKSGKRIGVKADDEKNTITFELLETCPYFAPMLSEGPYYPLSEEFYKEHKSTFGKTGCNSILYCGPFYCSELIPEHQFTLKKNTYYNEIPGLEVDSYAYIDEIIIENYQNREDFWDNVDDPNRYDLSIDYQERMDLYLYELVKNGELDALYTWSDELYKEYVVGPDGEGTLDNPYSDELSVLFNDKIGIAFGSFVNMSEHTSYSSFKDKNSNTIAAMKLNDFRRMLLRAFDYDAFFESEHGKGDSKDNSVHTFVPSSYVFDENGNEYVTTYLAKEYSEQKNISLEEAQHYLANGQCDTHQYDKKGMNDLVDRALEAIELYNNNATLVSQYGRIELPLTIEMFAQGHAYEESMARADEREINAMNARLNKLDNYSGDINECPYFRVVPTDLLTNANRDRVSWGQFDMCGSLWGWTEGAAFRDPYNYLRSFTKFETTVEAWDTFFPYLGEDYIADYVIENNTLVERNLLENYRQLVGDARFVTDLSTRYEMFAKAEYDLLENANIYQPRTSSDVGYRLAFARVTCVGGPKDAFSALLSGRLTGLWATEEPLSNEETQTMIEEEEEYSDEYYENHQNGIFEEQ